MVPFAEHMANQAHLAKIKNSNNKPLKHKQEHSAETLVLKTALLKDLLLMDVP